MTLILEVISSLGFAFLFKLVNPNEAYPGTKTQIIDVIYDVLVQ